MVVTAKKNIKKAKGGRKDLWTEADRTTAIRLWKLGKSAAEISSRLQGDHTRNAVLGFIHRNGLSTARPVKSPSLVPKRSKVANSAVLTRFVPKSYLPDAPEQTVDRVATDLPKLDVKCEPVDFLDLMDHQCRWPLDDGKFCGRTKKFGEITKNHKINMSSYCDVHHKITHRSHDGAP